MTGMKNQIMDILDDICFGPYTFEVALVLRDSLLINGILTNSEAWLVLSTAEVEQLEQADESLMRRILEVSQGCPKEMLYLELGCTPIRFIIMLRRIMFLHYMLHEDPNCLIQRVLQAQIAQPSKMTLFKLWKISLKNLIYILAMMTLRKYPNSVSTSL